jgi:hypothetical protein
MTASLAKWFATFRKFGVALRGPGTVEEEVMGAFETSGSYIPSDAPSLLRILAVEISTRDIIVIVFVTWKVSDLRHK